MRNRRKKETCISLISLLFSITSETKQLKHIFDACFWPPPKKRRHFCFRRLLPHPSIFNCTSLTEEEFKKGWSADITSLSMIHTTFPARSPIITGVEVSKVRIRRVHRKGSIKHIAPNSWPSTALKGAVAFFVFSYHIAPDLIIHPSQRRNQKSCLMG